MIIGSGLMFFSAFTGINSIIGYSSDIFLYAKVESAFLATVSVNAVNVIATIVSIGLVDKFGRTILLKISCATMMITLATLSFDLLYLEKVASESIIGPIAVACVLIYMAGFAIGVGAVCWVVMNEIMYVFIHFNFFIFHTKFHT